jgi:hypothetical protein
MLAWKALPRWKRESNHRNHTLPFATQSFGVCSTQTFVPRIQRGLFLVFILQLLFIFQTSRQMCTAPFDGRQKITFHHYQRPNWDFEDFIHVDQIHRLDHEWSFQKERCNSIFNIVSSRG